MTNPDEAASRGRDTTLAWASAANCLLYENDPGPATLNVGSADEPHMVDRSYAWQLAYAHFLLADLDADWSRLRVLDADLRDKITELGGEHGRRKARTRRRLRLVEPESDSRVRCWQRARDLCQLALDIVEQAGAVDDDTARRRLLAAAKHGNAQLTIGALGMNDEITSDYLDELDAINRQDHDR